MQPSYLSCRHSGAPRSPDPKRNSRRGGEGKEGKRTKEKTNKGKVHSRRAWPPLGPKVCSHLWLRVGPREVEGLFSLIQPKDVVPPLSCRFFGPFLLKKDALIRPSFRCRVFSFAAFFTKVSAISWPEAPLCPGTHRIIRAQILDASSTGRVGKCHTSN